MLESIGNWASIAGVTVSIVGLVIAITQIIKLRGESRAAKEAAEATRAAIRRDLTAAEITRVLALLTRLKTIHRSGNRELALEQYYGIIEALNEVRNRHTNLTAEQGAALYQGIAELNAMELAVESLEGVIPRQLSMQMNAVLSEVQALLLELRNRIPDSEM